MSTGLNEYYQEYYKKMGNNAYTMETKGHPSRIGMLKRWITKYTPKGGKILDIGCGDMYLSTLLPEYNWVGLDINIDKAKGDAQIQDIMQTPYPFDAGSFDTIMCSEVLEHVWDPRVINDEAKRLLKVGGVYAVSTPNFNWIEHFLHQFHQVVFDENKSWTIEHIRQYTPQTHVRLLTQAGFKIIDLSGADPQYSDMFNAALFRLKAELKDMGIADISEEDAHIVVGRMFVETSHTIMLLGQK